MTARKITEADGWLIDGSNNRNQIIRYASREAAETALLSNKNCRNCTNCSGCSGCSGCSDCSRCSDLYYKTGVTATEAGAANSGPPPVPTIPNIHSTIFAAVSKPGALDMGSWHKCQNTHCRAGWAVTLAGKEGTALESFYDTPLAAMMIYDASDPAFKINPGRFFDGNAAALADMKHLAEGTTP